MSTSSGERVLKYSWSHLLDILYGFSVFESLTSYAYVMKRFIEWIQLKMRLDLKSHKPPLVSERDIWWANIGENIGSEINGKSSQFSRPVIIFKKLSHSFYFVIPTTTRFKQGSWYVPFSYQGKDVLACLHQSRVIDYRRLSSRIGQIDSDDFERVRESFIELYLV